MLQALKRACKLIQLLSQCLADPTHPGKLCFKLCTPGLCLSSLAMRSLCSTLSLCLPPCLVAFGPITSHLGIL